MSLRTRASWVGGLALGFVLLGSHQASGQDPRLRERLGEPTRGQVQAIIDTAQEMGVPEEPLVDRALEGASKGADGDRIVFAVRRLAEELQAALDALGPSSSDGEITAGASALHAGARPSDLSRLRALRPNRPLTVAAAVLADLVAAGVPADTATAAVLALAESIDDAQYVAFRRSVERDIALGATPAVALETHLGAVTEAADTRRRP